VDCRQCWGQWRVFYYTEDRQLAYFPADWTDVGEADAFVILSRGRAVARVEDMLRLATLVRQLQAEGVKENKPDV
jgi:hypothetical protein